MALSVIDSVTVDSTSSLFAIETFRNLQVFQGGASYDMYAFIGSPDYVTSIDAGSGKGALDYTNYFDSFNPTNFSANGVSVNLIRKSAALVSSGNVQNSVNNITAVYGSSFDDTLIGGNGEEILFGSSGDDYIDGGAGSDILIGDYGADSLVSGTGFDLVTGDVYDPYSNYGDFSIPLQLVLERIQSQIWNGITSTSAFDTAVDRLRVGNNAAAPARFMTQRVSNTTLTAPAGYGSGQIDIPVFLGPDTPEVANGTTYTIINDNSTDSIRMFGTGSPTSATYLLYSGGPSNTSLADNISGSQLGIRRRNRTWIIQ